MWRSLAGGIWGFQRHFAFVAPAVRWLCSSRASAARARAARNAGHLTPTIGKDVYTCLRQWGVERGLALATFAEAAVDATEARIRALNLDCDYVGNGNIVAGLHPAHRKPLEAAAAAMSAAGLPASFLEDRDLRARGLPAAFRSGVLERRGGHLNPGKYAHGLRCAALAAGVRIFEHTAVTGVREGPQPRLRTAMGHVSARQVLIATNAYVQPDLAGAAGRILPLRVTLFQTEPLTVLLPSASSAARFWSPTRMRIFGGFLQFDSWCC